MAMSSNSNTFEEDKKGIDGALQALKVRDDEASISETPDHKTTTDPHETGREAGKSKTADTKPPSIAHSPQQLASHAIDGSGYNAKGPHESGDSKWDGTSGISCFGIVAAGWTTTIILFNAYYRHSQIRYQELSSKLLQRLHPQENIMTRKLGGIEPSCLRSKYKAQKWNNSMKNRSRIQ
jgi:hypothetical protein